MINKYQLFFKISQNKKVIPLKETKDEKLLEYITQENLNLQECTVTI